MQLGVDEETVVARRDKGGGSERAVMDFVLVKKDNRIRESSGIVVKGSVVTSCLL